MTTLEIQCQPWISMQTLEGLNFAEIDALFCLMDGTLHFHTMAPSEGGGATTNSPRMHRQPLGKSPGLILGLSAFLRHSGAPKRCTKNFGGRASDDFEYFNAPVSSPPLHLPNVEAMWALEVKENLGNA